MNFKIFYRNRQCRKTAKNLIQQARHLMNMRGDLLGAEVNAKFDTQCRSLSAMLKQREYAQTEAVCIELRDMLDSYAGVHAPRRNAFRENFEIIVVAVAAAMGLRAYFIQPFKIPTGSMQPTLYGITAVSDHTPGLMDRLPLKIVKVALTGEWYSERRAKVAGRLGEGYTSANDPSIVIFYINGKKHTIPKDAIMDDYGRPRMAFHPMREFQKDELIWSGVTRRGDHLFVNKVIWNFRRPNRDEVMVFTTDDIPTLEPGTHYIKRMCGMPGDRVAIHPPHLMIDDVSLQGFFGIDRVTAAVNGYAGYQLDPRAMLKSPQQEWPMQEDQYFALGDNTLNSRDSRYWGPVPERNLVGPAVFVYWPISRRWGMIR